MRLLALALVACGSAHPEPRPGAEGSEADITIRAGIYTGYEFHRRCKPGMQGVVAVVGLGRHRFPYQAKGYLADGNYDPVLLEDFRDHAIDALGGVYVRWNGFGGACRSDKGAFLIMLADYHDIDDAVRHVGRWLAAQDYEGEIDIGYAGPLHRL